METQSVPRKLLYFLKNSHLILLVIFLSLAGTRAMAGATADSVWLGKQQGTLTYGSSGVVTYKVYVRKSGNGGTGRIDINASSTVPGISVQLSSNHLVIGGNEDIDSSITLTVTISGTTGVGAAFTVAIQDGGNPVINTASPMALGINPLPLTPVFTVANKVYDGNTTATIMSRSVTGNIINGDIVSLLGTSGTATFDNKNVGTGKTVTASGFQLTGASAKNYYLNEASAKANITQRSITVTADAKIKTFNDGDPALTYQITSGSLAPGDAFTGTLTRAAGESAKSPNTYAIMQGSLSLNNNYSLQFIGANLTIHNIPITGLSTNFNPILCNGSTTSVAVTAGGGDGALQYQLSGTKSYSFQSASNFTNVPAGNYTLTVRDADGFISTSDVVISEPLALKATITNSTNVIGCWGAKNATLTVNGDGGTAPYNYSVIDPYNSTNGQTNTTGYFTELFGNESSKMGRYVKVTDANGCAYQVPEPVNLGTGGLIKNVSTVVTNVSCLTQGAITTIYSGGVGALTYHLDGPVAASNSTGIFADLTAGTYTISTSDTNGCTKMKTVVVKNQANLAVHITAKKNTSCSAANDGTVTLKPGGGKAPYLYSIDGNFSETAVFTDLAAGTYIGTVKDANGCTASAEFTIAASKKSCSVMAATQTDFAVANVSKLPEGISVQAFPNPSPTIFKVQIHTRSNEKVHVMVRDTYGRVLYEQVGTGDNVYSFGDKFPAGLYMLEVVQGSVAKTIKLIKQ